MKQELSSAQQALSSLSVYIPTHTSKVAHYVRHFTDTGEVYIFCNRHLGTPGGVLYSLAEFGSRLALQNTTPLCDKCQAAIEAALERVAVLQGLHPSLLKAAADAMTIPSKEP